MRKNIKSSGHRSAAGVALLVVLAAGAASGCGAGEEPAGAITQSPAPVGGTGLGGTGLGGAPPRAGEAGDAGQPGLPGEGGQPGAGGAGGAGYPGDARGYAEAVIAAWHGDLDRLAELTSPLVHDQLLQIPGQPASDWTNIQCDGGDCMFYNGDGDYLMLHIPLGQLGQPHAASHVTFQATTFPDHDLDYLTEFVAAWQIGNVARMHALAVPEVVAVYQQVPAGQVSSYGQAGGGAGLSIIVVTTTSAEIETHLGTTLLGGPQAVRKAIPEV